MSEEFESHPRYLIERVKGEEAIYDLRAASFLTLSKDLSNSQRDMLNEYISSEPVAATITEFVKRTDTFPAHLKKPRWEPVFYGIETSNLRLFNLIKYKQNREVADLVLGKGVVNPSEIMNMNDYLWNRIEPLDCVNIWTRDYLILSLGISGMGYRSGTWLEAYTILNGFDLEEAFNSIQSFAPFLPWRKNEGSRVVSFFIDFMFPSWKQPELEFSSWERQDRKT